MRIFVTVAIVIAAGQAITCGQAKPSTFSVPGIFSIDSPGKGFEWKHVATKEIKGTKGRIYLCTNSDDSARMVLIVEERSADSPVKRKATIAAHWNTLLELKDRGYTELSGKKPPLEEQIPDKVYYSISGKDPEKSPVFIRGATIFGKNIYGFQAMANTEAESKRLIELVKSFKELR